MAQTKYRVMHHIGGFPAGEGEAPTDMMLAGDDDNFSIINADDLPKGTDVDRLVRLGSLRTATSDEIERHDERAKQGARTLGSATSPAATTGNATDKDAGTVGDTEGQGAGARTPTGISKGELSEKTVPELREMARERGDIEGYSTMNKADLLNALTSPQDTGANS